MSQHMNKKPQSQTAPSRSVTVSNKLYFMEKGRLGSMVVSRLNISRVGLIRVHKPVLDSSHLQPTSLVDKSNDNLKRRPMN